MTGHSAAYDSAPTATTTNAVERSIVTVTVRKVVTYVAM